MCTQYRILVVDDHDDLLWIYQEMLAPLNFSMVLVNDPKQALEMLETEHFDLIISDYWMPGLTGDKFLSQAKALRPGIKTIMISTHVKIGTSHAPAFSEDYLLAKPFEEDELSEAILTVLPRCASQPPLAS